MNLQALLSDYQLGSVTAKQPLMGGLMHHAFLVTTDQGNYIVKQLNQCLMQFQWLETTEAIARAAKAKGFPARTALLHKGKTVYWQGDEAYSVYPYIEGESLHPEALGSREIKKIARLSASLHRLDLHVENPPPFNPFKTTETEWWEHLAGFESLLEKRLPIFLEIQGRYDEALVRLTQHSVLSHGDFTPANLLWRDDKLVAVIDWELAGFVNPEVEMLHNAIDVANTKPINAAHYHTYLKAYQSVSGPLKTAPADLMTACLESWVHWVLFCLKRQDHAFKPLETEKMVKSALVVIDFLLDRWKTVELKGLD